MTFRERVLAWIAWRPPEPTGADLDQLEVERQRRAGERFEDELAHGVAHGMLAHFPGDGTDTPRLPPAEPNDLGGWWMRWP